MTTLEDARSIALGLPGAVEQDHHGRPSWRVNGKIFTTVWDAEHLNVFIDLDEVDGVVAENPHCCERLMWGAKPSGVRVALAAADDALVSELLSDAYRRRAG